MWTCHTLAWTPQMLGVGLDDKDQILVPEMKRPVVEGINKMRKQHTICGFLSLILVECKQKHNLGLGASSVISGNPLGIDVW